MAPLLEVINDHSTITLDPYSVDSIENEAGNKNDLVLKVFRCLIADLCEQFKGGHPGYDTKLFCCSLTFSNVM